MLLFKKLENIKDIPEVLSFSLEEIKGNQGVDLVVTDEKGASYKLLQITEHGITLFDNVPERLGISIGRRLALHLVRRMGSRTLTLGYAVAFADLVLAPFTP